MKLICPRGHDKQQLGLTTQGSCAECNRVAAKRVYSQLTPDEKKAKCFRRNRSKCFREHNWRRYGVLTLEKRPFTYVDYECYLALQQNRCALCGKHQSELKKALCVDHDHSTGIVRGLLCTPCNRDVGVYERLDLLKIQTYLEI